MELWRISKFPALDGKGGELYSAKWNTRGRPVTYLAASPPGALLEVLVHLELAENSRNEIPNSYSLFRISVPNRLRILLLPVVGEKWMSDLGITRAIGDAWHKSKRSALARVPSAILPETFNYLLHPLHPAATEIVPAATHAVTLDKRLLW